jgi:hypothetical protein
VQGAAAFGSSSLRETGTRREAVSWNSVKDLTTAEVVRDEVYPPGSVLLGNVLQGNEQEEAVVCNRREGGPECRRW